MLNEQFHIGPDIDRFPSTAFHSKRIVDGPNVKRYACFDCSFEIVSPCHSLVDQHISYYRLSYDSPATIMARHIPLSKSMERKRDIQVVLTKTWKKLKESLNFFELRRLVG